MNSTELVKNVFESFKGLPVFPYHNFVHCVETAKRALAGSFYYGLPVDQRIALYTAALFHDANYLGDTDDTVNVQAAAKAWGGGGLVEELILSTANPWKVPAEGDPHALLKRILRDADILQSAEPHWKLLLEEELAVNATNIWISEHLTTDWGQEFFKMSKENSCFLEGPSNPF
jgi:hypothetical protein